MLEALKPKQLGRIETIEEYDGASRMKNTQVARSLAYVIGMVKPAASASERISDGGELGSELVFAW